MSLQGLPTMARINVRTGWKGLTLWVVGLLAMMLMTTTSITALYDTPTKLRGYAESVGGDAMLMLNGKVAGLGSLGGVIANEFGFILSFGIPLMAIALTARGTRKDEEAGRLELLLAARIGRHAPILSAVLVASAALALTGLGCAVAMIAAGVDAGGAVLYGAGVTGLGFVFVGLTAVAAQVFEHNRAVWGAGLGLAVVSYLLRGLGATGDNALLWLSPLGWVDEVRPFGEARAWPLLLALMTGAVLVASAFWLSTRRDVGSALVQPRGSKPEASAFLRSPVGLAWHEHRGAVVGWTVGAVALMATYGSLTNEVLDAIEANPAIGQMMGTNPEVADDFLAQVMSTFVMMLAMLVAAFAVMAIGSLRAEEGTGRMEAQLSGHRSRWAWLGVHVAVVAAGMLVVGGAGALALGWSSAASTGEQEWVGEILVGALAFLPAAVVFLALTVVLVGLAPRLRGLAWLAFGAAAVLAYLGPGFDLPTWLVDGSPFQAVGTDVVSDGMDVTGGVVLLALTGAGLAAGFVGFRARDIPRS
ncbi:MAG TPA: hypothetical protein VJ976_10445 [Ornithinimicrobium sp.]|uniref:ABC transporter permease n=1 Tax=Ornithinimicrobium sp. TaxID=1977084 RepID=UPI002B488240|nr:hypothetical protein [Ornithinimicrobium sp.]HKJ12790.1 hypothetical protein [Ornithinimicrobium sp.]